MFSFKNGQPIFRIKGGKNSNKKVKLDTSEEPNDKNFKEITVQSGVIQPLPPKDPDKRICVYVSGPSGSGKSTWASQFCKEYKKLHRKNKIVLFSPIQDDDNINELNPISFTLNAENILDEESKVTLEELKDTLCIFDDIDAISDKKIRDGVRGLLSEILLTGRHYNISTVCTSHILCNWKQSRDLLNESHMVVFFPKTNAYHIKNYLKNHCGFSKDQIQKILRLPSRWVAVHKNYPNYIISKDQAYII